ncbi:MULTISPECIES: condensation protein [unclassified Streptomyces]|uniref:condensation protein n=1 Tax=unclassified Streptomyces TaxID=2593676 RepID=UPI00225833A2|nr:MULTISPECIES: condensation protein [unclassified Streptomyces]MCX4991138.1 condensation protein [Streptomyces sp. NBC_00568]MCX5003625.1 condensation protein [Streptomyces sp. NBC_00638]
MTAVEHPARDGTGGPAGPAVRVPFPVVDEVARHCLQEEEPETVHIEVHLPGRLDPARLTAAFTEALRRHPRILMREAAGPWYRRRYEWELTAEPDLRVVSFPPPSRDALRTARTRALQEAPPLSASPPIRLEVVRGAGPAVGSEATDAVGGPGPEHTPGGHRETPDGRRAPAPEGAGRRAPRPDPSRAPARPATPENTGDPARPAPPEGTTTPGSTGDPAARAGTLESTREPKARTATPEDTGDPARKGTVLFLTINHTALDGPACLRVLATAAELYGGRDNTPSAPPVRTPDTPEPASGKAPSTWTPPARVAPGSPEASPGNGLIVTELGVPRRPKGSPYTVNDQLMAATALMVAHWNREHGARPRPLRITMPVDDRPRGTDMPIGNGTRLVEVTFAPEEVDASRMGELLRRTATRTRALKSADRPQLGHGAALLTAPVVPVAWRATATRGLRRAAGPWTSTVLLSNIGRIPYALDFGEEAGRAHAVWFSAPARTPRGLTVTTASTAGRLHLALRWSRSLLGHGDGAHLRDLFEHYLHATQEREATGG